MPTDPEEVERNGNASRVGIQFKMIETETGRIGMMVFNGEDDVDSGHFDIPSVSFNDELKIDVSE